eukprot:INCI2654.2.p1 GENE.INCI2654.2~~INCI2654.2.p1  ORF type:complete len:450 (+),score=57.92 INCI2654.2:545-1894(+)
MVFTSRDLVRVLDETAELLEVCLVQQVARWAAPHSSSSSKSKAVGQPRTGVAAPAPPPPPPPGSRAHNDGDLTAAELERRLQANGAKRGNLSCSMMWDTKCNIGLVCTTPSGAKVFFGNRKAGGGCLDVGNQNRFPTEATTSPVENIYFDAPQRGVYKFEVWCNTVRAKGASAANRVVTVRLCKHGRDAQSAIEHIQGLSKGDKKLVFTATWDAQDDARAARAVGPSSQHKPPSKCNATSTRTDISSGPGPSAQVVSAATHRNGFFCGALCAAVSAINCGLVRDWKGTGNASTTCGAPQLTMPALDPHRWPCLQTSAQAAAQVAGGLGDEAGVLPGTNDEGRWSELLLQGAEAAAANAMGDLLDELQDKLQDKLQQRISSSKNEKAEQRTSTKETPSPRSEQRPRRSIRNTQRPTKNLIGHNTKRKLTPVSADHGHLTTLSSPHKRGRP